MSVLDRLQTYSTRKGVVQDSVFDITKPEGAFLHCVHRQGYKMYIMSYNLKDEYRLSAEEYDNLLLEEQEIYDDSLNISQEQYASLSDSEKARYEEHVEFTELHNVLTTCGNQIINATAGSGKALTNETKVLTSNGFVRIDRLKIGDLVAGESGQFYEVDGIFPQGLKEAYKVVFSNGVEIPCSGDHLWTLASGVTKTTLELKIDDIMPQIRPVKYPSCPSILAIQPYLMGVLLSGIHYGLSKIVLTLYKSMSERVISALEDIVGVHVTVCDGGNNRLLCQIEDAQGELESMLRSFGYADDKELFIPKDYLMSGVGERFDLLEGILDSDGLWSETHYSFVSAEKQFLEDMVSLCRSLGCYVKYQNEGAIHIWAVGHEKLHSCSERYEGFKLVPPPALSVAGVVKLGYETAMTCILVNNPSHLFLTEGYISTHNTTALTFKIIHDIVTGEAKTLRSIPNGTQVSVVNKMWVCTFLRSGAADLEKTVSYWQRALGYTDTSNQISFSTLDAEFKRCLNAMGVATPIGSSEALYKCLITAINACNITRDGGYALTKDDYQIISGIVTYYRGRLDETKYRHPSCSDYGITPSILDLLVHQYSNNRIQAGIMDFEDIMELLYKYLYIEPNRAVQDFVANRYSFIYIDEFQDTSQMAYAILKFYGRGRLWLNRFGGDVKVVSKGGAVPDGMYTAEETLGKVVVVGDISQCLVEGSKIDIEDGDVIDVDSVVIGDRVKSCSGAGETCYDEVINVSKHYVSTKVYEVSTGSHTIRGTADHRVFGEQFVFTESENDGHVDRTNEITIYMLGKYKLYWDDNNVMQLYDSYEKIIEHTKYNTVKGKDCVGAVYERAVFEPVYNIDDDGNIGRQLTCDEVIRVLKGEEVEGVDNESVNIAVAECDIKPMMLAELSVGDRVLVYDNGIFYRETVKSVKSVPYSGYVYDISTKTCHNYISDGIVNHNCIYSFRGSDSRILAEEFDNDFRPTISELSVNWRCPTNILNPVIPSIHMNADSASQKIVASREGGEFKAYTFANYKLMLQQLKEDLQRDMNDNMKAVILCRTNYDGMVPAFMLESDRHFNFSISDSKMTMDSPLPKSIIGMTSLFTERSSPAVERSLKLLLPRRLQWGVNELVKVLKLNNKSIWDLDIDDLDYSCPYLVDFVKAVRKILFVNGKRDKSMEIDAYRFVLFYLMQNVYAGDSTYSEGARAFIEAILFLIDSNSFKTIYDFLEETEYLNDKLNGRIGKSNVAVQIATVHEYKGKECDSVYVWNDSDGVFPSSKCDVGVEEQLNEERRVHYIACTRAKKREHIYCMTSKVGMFVNEMDLTLESPQTVSVSIPKKNIIEEGEVIESL